MSVEENKALVRRFYDEVFNRGNLAAIDEICDPSFVDHNPMPGQEPGRDGLKRSFAGMRAAFPDMQVAVEDIIAEGDKVATHIALKGTHRGEFMGIAPSGKQVEMRVSDIVRVAGGKLVEC